MIQFAFFFKSSNSEKKKNNKKTTLPQLCLQKAHLTYYTKW